MEHFQIKFHLKKAMKKEILGEGTHGIIELYQCKDDHVSEKQIGIEETGIETPQENTENRNICNKKFVVKRIKLKKNWIGNISDESIDRFYKEYYIGILLDHPNIRKTLDIDVLSKSIIFEHISGLDLLDYSNNYNYDDTRDLVVLFRQVIDAVCYLHSMGICHLDLKLENILVEKKTGKIKLIDFAEASIIEEEGEIIYGYRGTYQYMAPEVINTNKCNSKKADLWCCGMILYNLYYNRMPWEYAKISDKRYMMHYKSIYAEDGLNKLLFCNNHFYNEWDNIIINKIFKTLLHPDSKKRKTAEFTREIFELIRFT